MPVIEKIDRRHSFSTECRLFSDGFQRIDVPVIDTAKEVSAKCLDDHGFCTLAVVELHPARVKHPIILFLELDAVAAVNRPFVQDGKD